MLKNNIKNLLVVVRISMYLSLIVLPKQDPVMIKELSIGVDILLLIL
jgi:hypothetical protein